ncbi:MAG: hypothetical protein OXG67_17155 [bacterium]|nr:hypothetical protein [bacterium]MCY3890199.1 hypothetical protein [bacterium]
MGTDSDGSASTVSDIQQAILGLPEDEYAQLREWFSDLDWERWDKQIEADADEGALDFLIADALEAKEDGTLQEL